jgi:hypothetical protein
VVTVARMRRRGDGVFGPCVGLCMKEGDLQGAVGLSAYECVLAKQYKSLQRRRSCIGGCVWPEGVGVCAPTGRMSPKKKAVAAAAATCVSVLWSLNASGTVCTRGGEVQLDGVCHRR